MRLQLPSIAAVVTTGLCLSAAPAAAGTQYPHSVRVQKTFFAPKGATTAVFDCETRSFTLADGLPCYGPKAIRSAYGLAGLIKAGFTGAGQTIVIVDAFGSPTALKDLKDFDAAFGLNDPPSFVVQTMPGTPAFDPLDPNHVSWAEEVSLDVQWSHAVAPRANIVLVVSKSNSDEDMLAAVNFALDKKLGDIISMSFGESETFLSDAAGKAMVQAWEKAFRKARNRNITLLASSGDEGASNVADEFGDIFGFRNISYPASSPNVTAVGGTTLQFGLNGHADPAGKYIGETVWNDAPFGLVAASGGGVSTMFERPDYQRHLGKDIRNTLNGARGIPDVAFVGDLIGGVVVKLGFFSPADPNNSNGFFIFGGTSVGAPSWAGIVADINQLANRQLGFLNDRIYRLGRNGIKDDDRARRTRVSLFHDITVGDNTVVGFDPGFNEVTVNGFPAGPDFDLSTGWGTPNLGALMDLIDDLCRDGGDR
jgi:subtilase family serine protease